MAFTVENWPLAKLQANPDNYRHHPERQVEQLRISLREHGVYKNIVATPDGIVLAGHGVVAAAMAEGITELPVYVYTGTEEQQRKLMVADNELSRMAEDDDAQLSQLLSAIQAETGLEGTGFDDEGLAAEPLRQPYPKRESVRLLEGPQLPAEVGGAEPTRTLQQAGE